MNVTSQHIKQLFAGQLREWPLAKANYEALKDVESKEFSFGGFSIRVQYNPARILSSAAKVDAESVRERKCFLCPENLPAEQRGIPFGDNYRILVNPYPIFPEHFTIPAHVHTGQLIIDRYGDMLDMAKYLDEYIIFYNGPRCGASAPDHAHFQAGAKGFLPVEDDIHSIDKEEVAEASNVRVYTLRNYFRNAFLTEAKDKDAAIDFFRKIYALLETKDGDKEPMMNILAWYGDDTWRTVIFPREKHRPACFYAEGEDNMLISPASVDFGGIFITPREKDFDKITPESIAAVLKETSISDEKTQAIINRLKEQIWNLK